MNTIGKKLRLTAAACVAAAITMTAFVGNTTAQAAPQQEAVHYFQLGHYSSYILPVPKPASWDITTNTGGQRTLHVTVRNTAAVPTVAEVHSALASPDAVRIRVPAGGEATASIPVTQAYVIDRWNRGLGVTGAITVTGAEYQAGAKHWRETIKSGSPKAFRSSRLAFYGDSGYRVIGLDILPAGGVDMTARGIDTSPLRQSPPEIGAGQLETIGELYALTGGLPEGGTFQRK